MVERIRIWDSGIRVVPLGVRWWFRGEAVQVLAQSGQALAAARGQEAIVAHAHGYVH